MSLVIRKCVNCTQFSLVQFKTLSGLHTPCVLCVPKCMCVLFILLLLLSHWFSSRHFQVTFRALRIRQDLNINMASSTRRSFGQGELSGRPFARSHGSANYNDGRGQFGQRFSQQASLPRSPSCVVPFSAATTTVVLRTTSGSAGISLISGHLA